MTEPAKTESAKKKRLPALDLARGVAILIMTIDHASKVFNDSRINTDSALRWTPGSALPTAQFLTRWITHLCAPAFVFLAGAALALSTERRLRRGDAPAAVDAHLRKRGLILLALELVWMSPVMLHPTGILLQVLFVLGGSIIAMSWLRRLSDRVLLALGLGIVVFAEAAIRALTALHVDDSVAAAVLLVSGRFADGRFVVAYPLLPWLAVMMIGWAFGRALLRWQGDGVDVPRKAARVLTVWGLAAVAVYAAQRAFDGYGNMGMYRDGDSILQWLHLSKYPPSLAFVCLELGLAVLMMAGFFRYTANRPNVDGPLLSYGQTALFFYLLHVHVMALFALIVGWTRAFGVGGAYLGAAGVIIVLYPAVRWYQRYKAAHPNNWSQYI